VELLKRPAAQPRIEESEPAEPGDAGRTGGALRGGWDPEEIPGRHKRAASRSRSVLASSIAAQPEAPGPSGGTPEAVGAEEPVGSQAETAGPVQQAGRRAPAATGSGETEFRSERPSEVGSEPPVVAMAPRPPERVNGDVGERSPTSPVSVSEPAESTTVAPREREPEGAASKEIARAEIPGVRVERTVWHPIAERRVATIQLEQTAERREIHEGDAVGPLVVSEIEPSGVVFVHEGVELRRRIGE
jgi:hypothetical protein